MYRANPVALPPVTNATNAPAAEEHLKELKTAQEEALAAHELACLKMTQRTMRQSKPFKEGEKVWLESKNLCIPYQSQKLTPKQEGPVTYQLKLPSQWKIHDMFHVCLLSPYKENDVHRPNHTNPPPNLIDGAQEYEVETLLAHR